MVRDEFSCSERRWEAELASLGYQVDGKIASDSSVTLLAATRMDDGRHVVLKSLDDAGACAAARDRFFREYENFRTLEGRGVPSPLGLVSCGQRPLMVLDDSGSPTLQVVLRAKLDLRRALQLGRSLALALDGLHRSGFVHNDLRPEHIVARIESDEVRFLDLGRAGHSPVEPHERGSFVYVAPEQTGRVENVVDSRADLYCAGMILYRALSGRLPFEAADTLEWLHCHLARPPMALDDDVPPPVARIVTKLLEKAPENRIQSAAALASDLAVCLGEDGTPRVEPSLARCYESPRRIYGRERELARLRDAYERVRDEGRSELVLIAGRSGAGKSALIREFAEQLDAPGRVTIGKCDQGRRALPYSAVSQAIRGLLQDVLGASDEKLEAARRLIGDAVGSIGFLAASLAPELELLLGPQSSTSGSVLVEAEHRFHSVVRRLVEAFAERSSPLLFVLDDLQWLDPATRRLLEALVLHGDELAILWVGAYRTEEVDDSHPLTAALRRIDGGGGRVSAIEVGPLDTDAIGELLADLLHTSVNAAAPFADVVFERTKGNAHFAIEWIRTVLDERLIMLDADAGTVRWSTERLRDHAFADDVAELLVRRIRALPESDRHVLATFAVLGHDATTSDIESVCSTPPGDVVGALHAATRAALVFCEGERWKFVHDRVQQAAYELVPTEQRPQLHLEVGRLLMVDVVAGDDQQLFAAVGQMSRALEAIDSPDERARVLELALRAGRRARASAAYASAADYFGCALRILPAGPWRSDYQSTLGLLIELAECECLAGHYELADEHLSAALTHVRSPVDRARVLRRRMRVYQLAGRPGDAAATMLDGLATLDVVFPEDDEAIAAAVQRELAQIPVLLGDRRIEELADAPRIDDPRIRAIVRLLDEGLAPVYTAHPTLWALVAARAATLSLEHGTCEGTAFTYVAAALLLSLFEGDSASAVQFSRMALRLNKRFEETRWSLHRKLLFHHVAMVAVWTEPLAPLLPQLDEAFHASVEVGDFVYAGYMTYNITWMLFESGAPLPLVVDRAREYAAFARKTHNPLVEQLVRLQEAFAAELGGDCCETGLFATDHTQAFIEAGFAVGAAFELVMKLVAAYWSGDYVEAHRYERRASVAIASVPTLLVEASYHLYRGLTAAALYNGADSAEHDDNCIRVLAEEVARHERWADACGSTFGVRLALLAGELARIEGRVVDAELHYETATTAARSSGFISYEALSLELASRFYRARGLTTIADAHTRRARTLLERWGAATKSASADPETGDIAAVAANGNNGGPVQVDVDAVARATRAISQQIVHADLIDTMMRVLMETSGAEVATLLLVVEGRLRLAASGVVAERELVVQVLNDEVPSASLPMSVVRSVRRTGESVLLLDAARRGPFTGDPYFRTHPTRSVAAVPIVRNAEVYGVLYLENAQVAGVFVPQRMEVVQVLAAQAAISLQNAQLYADREREIVERRHAERALEESQALLQDIVDKAATAICVKDLEGRFLLVNERFAADVGREPEWLLGRTDYDVFPPETADLIRATDRRVLETGVASEETVDVCDGSRTYLLVRSPLVDGDGRVYAICGISTDISAHKQAEQTLRQTQEQLLQAQKMEAIGNLAGGVAHDFNNILTVILSGCEFLAEETAANDPRRMDVDEIHAAGRRAADLTQQLLAFSRRQVVRPRNVLLDEVVTASQKMLRRLIGEDIELRVEVDGPVVPVRLDPIQVDQVVLNLVVNSRDAMPDGGEIVIALSSTSLDDSDLVGDTVATPGTFMMLSVTDTGAGISDEAKERIFEPFYTTKEVGRGTGLGLSTVFGIVQQNAGLIRVESRVGVGTTFRVCFPAVEGTEQSEGSRDETTALEPGTKTILVVEDEASVRRVTVRMLERGGYRVLDAAGPEEAISIFREHEGSIDLLLSDVVMPGMNGPQLLERLRKFRPNLGVLFMSGYTGDVVVNRGGLDPETQLVQKPVTSGLLCRRVGEMLR